ncbi:MAG: chorismate mutase [Acidobacteria bacterium]|nr:MAG: chorismate mutase [Acidobacteriota bacterium]
MSIEDWRRMIDEVDRQIVELINKRAMLCRKIGHVKHELGLPVIDLSREREIINNALANNSKFISDEGLERIFRVLIKESRNIQVEAQINGLNREL